MNTQLSWAERLALKVERKFPLGRLGWLVVYGIALLALLPTLMSLGLGTGLVICAYATEGLYSLNDLSPVQTLLWNLSCSLLGWFFCSWVILLCRCLRSHWLCAEYEARCPLWISSSAGISSGVNRRRISRSVSMRGVLSSCLETK